MAKTFLLYAIDKRTLFIIVIIIIGMIILMLNHTTNDIPISKTNLSQSLVPHRPLKIPQTCLSSYDHKRLHKSHFHTSMVHFAVPSVEHWVRNKTAFEIGGPSLYTWGGIGFYEQADTVDVTNFASETLWESGLKDGSPFLWNNKPKGIQYVRDAVDLKGIPNDHYDLVLSSHVIEHIANPFKALLEWIRILKSGGLLMTIAPWREETFDHKRNIDRIEHLINDYNNRTTEADLSHLEEIVPLHDFSRDLPAQNAEFFRERSKKNLENRGLHQHVYDQALLYYIYLCLDLEIKTQYSWGNSHLIIGQKK